MCSGLDWLETVLDCPDCEIYSLLLAKTWGSTFNRLENIISRPAPSIVFNKTVIKEEKVTMAAQQAMLNFASTFETKVIVNGGIVVWLRHIVEMYTSAQNCNTRNESIHQSETHLSITFSFTKSLGSGGWNAAFIIFFASTLYMM